MTDFSINNYDQSKAANIIENKIGFVMRKSSSESEAQQDLETVIDKGTCLLDVTTTDDFIVNISSIQSWSHTNAIHTITSDNTEGLYTLIFVICEPKASNQQVSFNLKASFYNPGPNYLSAGDAPLPILYLSFFVMFLLATLLWCTIICKCFGYNGIVHRIHYMMAALIILKSITLLFDSIRLYYISINGDNVETWQIVYFIFMTLKGMLLFTVILLIGSGWSLMKPYLNDKEKRIILCILILQVICNISMIVIEETAPGSLIWLTWRDILHLIDIICCCSILFTIVWSIRHLRQASEIDGKAQQNLQKLTLFRSFYIIVIIYIYFTRIIVLLLSAVIPYRYIWLGDFCTELATLIFYTVTGVLCSVCVYIV